MSSPMLTLALACTGSGADTAGFPADLAAELQEALDASRLSVDGPGAAQAVLHPEHGLWVGASGEADLSGGTPVQPDDRFRIGSVTKTFVGAAVVALAQDGVLSLDDSLGTWAAAYPDADRFTIRQLLGHETGIPDYVTHGDFLAAIDEAWDPWDLLALRQDEELLFTPGEGFSYSNANYVLLGLVMEAATGEHWTATVRSRLLDPLGLEATSCPSTEESSTIRGHAAGYDNTDDYHPSVSGASGEMVSTAEDLVTWITALYGGEVLDAEHTGLVFAEGVLPDGTHTGYGLGQYIDEWAVGPTVGHSGSVPGFQSRVRLLPRDGTTVVSLVNDYFSEADELDRAAWVVLGHLDE